MSLDGKSTGLSKRASRGPSKPTDDTKGVLALGGAIVRSARMREVLNLVVQVAPSDANILITGESGVGKEVIARALHQLSHRCHQEFVAINCASLSGATLENELFGHEKGAFTSADAQKSGMFEVAHEGTLFLDEVSEMELACQAKVLRVLERKEFRRLGGTKTVQTNVRIITATNQDLEARVQADRFRSDLFYRLNVVHLPIPPLRERREAIGPMAEQFAREYSTRYKKRPYTFTEAALLQLNRYSWPGNVRELRNLVESLVLITKEAVIDVSDLPHNIQTTQVQTEIRLHLGMSLQDAEKEILRCYLAAYPTKKEAARVLGIGLRTLHAKVRAYDLPTRGSLSKPE